jgi:aminoglycoside phosphotransferase (APT) family kinase protein
MSHGRDEFGPVLAALATDGSTEFGAPGARVERLRRIDGPFSSVQHVRVTTSARITHAYIKILRPRRPGEDELARIDRMLRREYLATQALHEALGGDHGIGAVRPLALLADHRALVTEEVPGRPFGELLVEHARPLEALAAVASAIGRWIRLYQGIGDTTGSIALAERRQYLDDRLHLLVGRVLSPVEREATLSRFDALARAIGSPAVRAVPIHADLTPLNIIVDEGGRMTVLDFTMAKTGTVYHDLSHVFFHLELMAARRGREASFRALQHALLSGYAPALTAEDPLFRLMLLQHGVCHVALLAERRVPVLDAAYRWFMRRRWRLCERTWAPRTTAQAV